ncbi:hypothetical protein DAPPUDRAFT_320059 [Daphnia pulex]|uniref:Uncharacterized protein n=1 Tax=Daphnia pulex TaxID=6669 RepID=E9GNQ3_DAPPU|nr:hypothetical protein DAPPUDRAFT_320059 [Daphnia pulex]|eukprot:EFX78918.1 hypothetical protein DAPPUDRAFT_320059 [Daphnia pulex]
MYAAAVKSTIQAIYYRSHSSYQTCSSIDRHGINYKRNFSRIRKTNTVISKERTNNRQPKLDNSMWRPHGKTENSGAERMDFITNLEFRLNTASRRISYKNDGKQYHLIASISELQPCQVCAIIHQKLEEEIKKTEIRAEDLRKVLEGNKNIFATSDADFGKAIGVEHCIETVGPQIFMPPRRQPRVMLPVIDDHVEMMLENDVIEERQTAAVTKAHDAATTSTTSAAESDALVTATNSQPDPAGLTATEKRVNETVTDATTTVTEARTQVSATNIPTIDITRKKVQQTAATSAAAKATDLNNAVTNANAKIAAPERLQTQETSRAPLEINQEDRTVTTTKAKAKVTASTTAVTNAITKVETPRRVLTRKVTFPRKYKDFVVHTGNN